MKALLIHHRIPFPLNSGMDKVRYNLIRSLALEHEITLIAPVDEYTKDEEIEQVRKICHWLILVPVENKYQFIKKKRIYYLKRWLKHIFYKIPLYIIDNFYIEVAQRIREETRKHDYDFVQTLSDITGEYLKYINSSCKKIHGPLDDSVESARTNMEVASGRYLKFIWNLKFRARKAYQPKVCKMCDWVFFFTTEDQNRIRKLAGNITNTSLLPTAVEPDDQFESIEFSFNEIEKDSIIFVGGLGSFFNQYAVLHFYYNIFPIIRNQIPKIRFYIVGQNPPKSINDLATDKNLIITGKVPDVRIYIMRAQVYIAPVYSGTGFKTKIVEALSLGKPIVATKKALQGLWDTGDRAICVCNDDKDFASSVINLLKDEKLRDEYGKRARELFEMTYKFDVVAPKTLEEYRKIEAKLF